MEYAQLKSMIEEVFGNLIHEKNIEEDTIRKYHTFASRHDLSIEGVKDYIAELENAWKNDIDNYCDQK